MDSCQFVPAGRPVSSLNKGGAAVGGGGFDVSANLAPCCTKLGDWPNPPPRCARPSSLSQREDIRRVLQVSCFEEPLKVGAPGITFLEEPLKAAQAIKCLTVIPGMSPGICTEALSKAIGAQPKAREPSQNAIPSAGITACRPARHYGIYFSYRRVPQGLANLQNTIPSAGK